jgi:hypothetical protein
MMKTHAALMAVGFATAAPVAFTPTSQATLPSVSPGNRIDYLTGDGSASYCTIGYTYIGTTDDHAYAVTAGHCQPDEPG